MKKEILKLSIIILINVAFMHLLYQYNFKFLSGLLGGATATIAILVTIGRWQANSIARNIEKRTRDYIANN